ncbi:cation diffusion facilitator family transporter [Kordiimonas pumila]|uniref:Cation diffusion facilitator family transporter n=1 Tax=Kordiimonas pumila TaxID=2161677 RepID=A0ABV7D8B8_9PROT|nr:cation diffusion facilitator family transporter [Kordiimonas pumila]
MDKAKAGMLMRWASRAAITVSFTLVLTKAVAWWLSDSVAMFGSLTDSFLDLAASLVTLFAIKTALTPADEEHRFGHGKAEALAGLFQAAVMSGSAVFIALEAIGQITDPQEARASNLVIAVSGLAIVLSLILVVFQAYVVKKTGSLAIAGDNLHYKGDLLLNLGVMASAYAVSMGVSSVDGIAGLMIAAYIVYGAYDIVKPALDMLMDKELSDRDRETIFNLAHESPGVRGLNQLKTRQAGRDCFIQMNIEVDGNLSVNEGHMIATEIEATLSEEFPDADIVIHIEPSSERSVEQTFEELPKLEE